MYSIVDFSPCFLQIEIALTSILNVRAITSLHIQKIMEISLHQKAL